MRRGLLLVPLFILFGSTAHADTAGPNGEPCGQGEVCGKELTPVSAASLVLGVGLVMLQRRRQLD